MAKRKSMYYQNMRAYEYDPVSKTFIIGRPTFRIGGQMSDGTKCWYKVKNLEQANSDPEMASGELDYDHFYTMRRSCGIMIAVRED